MAAKGSLERSSKYVSNIVLLSAQENPLTFGLATELGVQPGFTYKGNFSDGSTKTQIGKEYIPAIDRGATVVVVIPYVGDDVFVRNLEALRAAREIHRHAHRIVVSGIFPQQRQDRAKNEGTLNAAGLRADLIREAGATHIIAPEVHASRAFHPPIINLDTTKLLAAHAARDLRNKKRVVVAGPDQSAEAQIKKMGKQLRKREVPVVGHVWFEKHRLLDGTVITGAMQGDVDTVAGATICIVDDIGSSLGSIGNIMSRFEGSDIYVTLAHGTFDDRAINWLPTSRVVKTYITNSQPQDAMVQAMQAAGRRDQFRVVPIEPMIATTIRRIDGDQKVKGVSRRRNIQK